MKRILTIAAFTLSVVFAAAGQGDASKMSVRSFVMAENDNTANFYGTTVLDQNGDPCALIRVQTTQTGFAWDFGHMAPCKVEQKTGEIWVYVPYGVKRVTVRHAQLGTMTYEFPIPVAKARTYVMDLVAANVVVIVEQEVTQQYVVFKVTPPDAVVELDGQMLETKNGVARKKVKFGKYAYSVTARDYHPFSGEVEVKGVESATTVEVSLVPAFGTLSFENASSLSGAVVFIDNDPVGTMPVGQDLRVPSGKHSLKINRPRYKAYTSTFEISDGQNLVLSPQIVPNFTEVSITTTEGAEIFANDVRLGKAPWKGELMYDSYSFEVRMPSHRSMYRSVDFYEDSPAEITLPAPIPIYGSIDVDCDQTAQVSIDGVPAGEAPCVIAKVLVGEHVVTLSAPGYVKATQTVTVREGQEEKLSVTLVKGNQPSREQSQSTFTPSPYAPVASYPTISSSAPKVKKNMFYAGTGILKFTDVGVGDGTNIGIFHMYSFSAGYKHYFIKKHFGVSVGTNFCYSMRNGFNGADFSYAVISVPIDLVLRFGGLRVFGGYCLGCNFAEGRTEGFSMNLIHTGDGWSSDDPPLLSRMMEGYQAGVQYEFGRNFCVGYAMTGNIRSLSVGSYYDSNTHWETFETYTMSHMIFVGLMF